MYFIWIGYLYVFDTKTKTTLLWCAYLDCFNWISSNDITNLTNQDPGHCTTFTSSDHPIGSQLSAQVNINTECFESTNHVTLNITTEGLTSCSDLDYIMFSEYQTAEQCESLNVYKCEILNPLSHNVCSVKCPCVNTSEGRCTLNIVFTPMSQVNSINICSMVIVS